MKTATISELEREELMAQEFPMEDLETVYGGVEMEEPDEDFWGEILAKVLISLIKTVIVDLIKWAWEKFWAWIKEHKELIIAFLAAVPGPGWYAAGKYAAMSNSEREKLWRSVYNKYH